MKQVSMKDLNANFNFKQKLLLLLPFGGSIKTSKRERMTKDDQAKMEIEEVVDQLWKMEIDEVDIADDTLFVVGDAPVGVVQVTLL